MRYHRETDHLNWKPDPDSPEFWLDGQFDSFAYYRELARRADRRWADMFRNDTKSVGSGDAT